MTQQLTMVRRAASVGAVDDMLTVGDMAVVLQDAGYPARTVADALEALLPTQGNVSAHDRLQELLGVLQAYTPEFLLWVRKAGAAASWSSLIEPARWWREGKVEREDVEAFVRSYVQSTGRWPQVDTLRRRYNFAPTTKGPGDQPGQETLGQEVPA